MLPQRNGRRVATAVLVTLGLSLLAGCGEPETKRPLQRAEELCFAISSVYVAHDRYGPGESLSIALDVLEELRSGRSVAEVAKQRMQDPKEQRMGAFLGFKRPNDRDTMTQAYQALPAGMAGGPVSTEGGFFLLYRHTFAEGRDLESKRVVPVYGLLIPFTEGPPVAGEIEKAEAEKRAKEAWQLVKDGTLGILEAERRFSPSPSDRPSGHIVNAWPESEHDPLREAVVDLEPGEMAPVLELPGAYAVLKRGEYLRSVVFHITIQHSETDSRHPAVTRSRSEAEKLAKKALAEVDKDGSNWDEMVRKYTDETPLLPTSGFIGPVTNGDLIESLENSILATEPGRVADEIAETPGGFHIVWRAN